MRRSKYGPLGRVRLRHVNAPDAPTQDDELRERCVGMDEWGRPSQGGSRILPVRDIDEDGRHEPEEDDTPDVLEMMSGRER